VRRQTKDQRANPHRGLAFYSCHTISQNLPRHPTVRGRILGGILADFWQPFWPPSVNILSRDTVSH
jgi:hypothetical protein